MVDLPLSSSKTAAWHIDWDFIEEVVAQRGEKAQRGDSGDVPSSLFPGLLGAGCMFSDTKPDNRGGLTVLALAKHPPLQPCHGQAG